MKRSNRKLKIEPDYNLKYIKTYIFKYLILTKYFYRKLNF